MLVFLDRQHVGQIKHLESVGAISDVNNDGVEEIWEAEAIWTGWLSMAIEINLRKFGHSVIPITDGSYSERHARVNNYTQVYQRTNDGPVVYIALHLNAGAGGNYGAFFYDYRSGAGADLSQNIADSMQLEIQEIPSVKTIPATPDNWTKNAYYTIKNVKKPVSICSEPLFIDNETHKTLLNPEGLNRLGYAIARGINNWSPA